MSDTIDYIDATVKCENCDAENEVIVVTEQDNRSGAINTCLSATTHICINCGEKLSLDNVYLIL